MVPSLDGRRVDLITVTSYSGMTEEREPRLNGLFPSEEPRAKIFQGKKVIATFHLKLRKVHQNIRTPV